MGGGVANLIRRDGGRIEEETYHEDVPELHQPRVGDEQQTIHMVETRAESAHLLMEARLIHLAIDEGVRLLALPGGELRIELHEICRLTPLRGVLRLHLAEGDGRLPDRGWRREGACEPIDGRAPSRAVFFWEYSSQLVCPLPAKDFPARLLQRNPGLHHILTLASHRLRMIAQVIHVEGDMSVRVPITGAVRVPIAGGI